MFSASNPHLSSRTTELDSLVLQLFQTWNCVTLSLSLSIFTDWDFGMELPGRRAKYLRWSEVSIFYAMDLFYILKKYDCSGHIWRSALFGLNIDLRITPPSLPSERKLLLPALPASLNRSCNIPTSCSSAFKILMRTDKMRVHYGKTQDKRLEAVAIE